MPRTGASLASWYPIALPLDSLRTAPRYRQFGTYNPACAGERHHRMAPVNVASRLGGWWEDQGFVAGSIFLRKAAEAAME
jgi:hypothetical protein